jgi:Flp pilus assembly protein TadD
MDITTGSLYGGVFGAIGNQSAALQQVANSALSSGAQRLQQKDYDGAIREFKRSTAYNPTNTMAYRLMGRTFQVEGKLSDATSAYEKAVQIDPTNIDARLELGRAYVDSGRWNDAEAQFKAIAKANPGDPTGPSWLGNLYLQRGRYAEAETQFQTEVRLLPNDPSAHHDLGMAFQAMGDQPKALAEFQRAASLDQQYAPAYADAGYSYLQLNQPDDAQKMVDQLDALGTTESQALSNDLQLAMFTPQIAFVDPAKSDFLSTLGPGTPLSTLDPSLATPGASKTFALTFRFNQSMDPASVQDPTKWLISKSQYGDGGVYNNGANLHGSKEVGIAAMPIAVRYDQTTGSATVYFRVTQNANGDGVMDPSHWQFRFSGKDVGGNPMDPRFDTYDGYRGTAY